MHYINIISNYIVNICNDLVEILNSYEDANKIDEFIVKDYLLEIRNIANLEKFYVYRPDIDRNYSFDIELYFLYYEERFVINFTRKLGEEGTLKFIPSVKNRIIIASNPTQSTIDGIIYCDNRLNILFLDQFIQECKFEINNVYQLEDIKYSSIIQQARGEVFMIRFFSKKS